MAVMSLYVFIDFSTAFDTVNYWKLFTELLNETLIVRLFVLLLIGIEINSVLLDGAAVYLPAFI